MMRKLPVFLSGVAIGAIARAINRVKPNPGANARKPHAITTPTEPSNQREIRRFGKSSSISIFSTRRVTSSWSNVRKTGESHSAESASASSTAEISRSDRAGN